MRHVSKILLITIWVSVVVSYVTAKAVMPDGGAQGHSEQAYDHVMKTGILRCGYGISPPALVKDVNTGKISGLDFEIWDAIGKQLGLKVEWTEEAGWGNFIEGLRTHRYDAFCTRIWPDRARAKFLTLTQPVTYSFINTYVRADDHRFDSGLNSINKKGVTVPAVEGDVTEMMAQTGFPNAKILYLSPTSTVSDVFMSVTTKKADAVFVEEAMFTVFDKANPGQLRRLSNVKPAFVFPAPFSVNHGEYALRDMIDVALRTLIDDGTIARIAAKYSADYIPASKNFEAK